eukprot:5706121-Amphidinium_carterae.1
MLCSDFDMTNNKNSTLGTNARYINALDGLHQIFLNSSKASRLKETSLSKRLHGLAFVTILALLVALLVAVVRVLPR